MTAPAPRLIRAGAPGGRASFGVVALHGRGAPAEGMVDLVASLGLPDLAVAAPEAPGNSWWPTSFLAPAAQMAPFVDRGLAAVSDAVAALEADGLTRDRIVVLGFSQGACLALEYAARHGGGLRAAVGLSGGLVGGADVDAPSDALYGFADKALDYDTDLSGVAVQIGVHARDPHIPLKRARDSAAVFERLGAEVTFTEHPGAGHGVTEGQVADLRALLNV